ncbi:hypothetical protein DFH07DRAFT_830338 [Mycena maculata]|uniref:Uncharacterized protein n=1 Tax=Mycena maculata TaxID=230809 RepID=A0AAD7IQE4_9AGAR|nr:hypothetical protein DFH07DRAFT_830338 [Mycena maculata]
MKAISVGFPFLPHIIARPTMLLTNALWMASLLSGLARAALTNFTIDDTSPAVVYAETPFARCDPSVCPSSNLFNGTSSFTASPINISFTGNAVYVHLGASGLCFFSIDGLDTGSFFDSTPGDGGNIYLAYRNTTLADTLHTLTIQPITPGAVIQFDYLVYTHNVPSKLLVGAIVGGVVGGVVFTVGLSIAALFLGRRDRRRKLATRGIPLGDHWPDRPSLKLMQLKTQE